ncbi:hypothetical protein [Nonomuraea salmonea]|uniref:hypothetical protein n=1 Tax=Nonomuraea salmonea TaxID=46181 RepID=UPI0031EB76A3
MFGCSAALRHTLAPDSSAITFAAKADLTRRWIVAIRLTLRRDWTWDALDPQGLEIIRDDTEVVGFVSLPRGPGPSGADRSRTEVVFFDAIDPTPEPGAFPDEMSVGYKVHSRFREAPAQADQDLAWTLRLPVATAPTQTPRLRSAGVALSPYVPAPDYSSTEQRQRRLWLEFDEPPLDPLDRLYARVLAYAPDPMLLDDQVSVPDPQEPPLPVDPEQLRIIVPGQPADDAGLGIMQELVASDLSPNHFILPLPQGLDQNAEELFGFFVYEVRVGHNRDRWCTAQGRYGPPLRVSGVQHPAPPLTCTVVRVKERVMAAAPYAAPLIDGWSQRPNRPKTELWGLLYTRVLQADGASFRNVLLGSAQADWQVDEVAPHVQGVSTFFGEKHQDSLANAEPATRRPSERAHGGTAPGGGTCGRAAEGPVGQQFGPATHLADIASATSADDLLSGWVLSMQPYSPTIGWEITAPNHDEGNQQR